MTHVKLEVDGAVVYESGVIVAPGPVDPPPPPPPPQPAEPEVSDEFKALVAQTNPQLDLLGIIFHLHRAMTPAELAYARLHNVPGANPDPAPEGSGQQAGQFDPRVRRDLTGLRGNPLIVEGGAEHPEVLQFTEPAGRTVQIEVFRVNSNFGSCNDAEIVCQGRSARGTGSDAQASLTITTTGNDPVRVVLHQAGGVGVQVNPA